MLSLNATPLKEKKNPLSKVVSLYLAQKTWPPKPSNEFLSSFSNEEVLS